VKQIFSISETARRLGVSRQFLAGCLKTGTIQADYESESGKFFSAERVAELQAINNNAPTDH